MIGCSYGLYGPERVQAAAQGLADKAGAAGN
jgi:hypothetical protein